MGAKPLCKLTRIRVKREEENIIKLGGIKGFTVLLSAIHYPLKLYLTA